MWHDDLKKYRIKRNFNAEKYINAKCILLNEYMKLIDHSCVVIGISGGIDSATVLALVLKASTHQNSPIKRIVAVSIPEFVEGTTGQYEAFMRAKNLVDTLKIIYDATCSCAQIDFNCADLTNGYKSIRRYSGVNLDGWGAGQLVSCARTSILYSIVSGYYSMGYPAILCGTTNFDEGSYIGYFGKASDGCVDVQLISDIHKSEVNKIAKLLGITDEILNVAPAGDLYNGMTDEQYIGAPYDFMELYFGTLMGNATVSDKSCETMINWISKIEKMREQALHKYVSNGYSIRLKLYDDIIEDNYMSPINRFDPSKFVNYNSSQLITLIDKYRDEPVNLSRHKVGSDDIFIGNNLLSSIEIESLVNLVNRCKHVPVANTGYIADYIDGNKIGSHRFTCYDEKFSAVIWNRLKHNYPSFFDFSNVTSVDSKNCSIWRPVGISPLMRFIVYKDEENDLLPHYDFSYVYTDGLQTHQSLIIYLTDCHDTCENFGGETIFIVDENSNIPMANRSNENIQDWTREATNEEIIFSVKPVAGQFMAFNHGIRHAGKNIKHNDKVQKIIIRTDIIFEKCLPQKIKRKTRPINFKECSVLYSDKFFKSASTVYGPKQLKQAGFITTKRNPKLFNDKQNLLVTPLYKICENLKDILKITTKYELIKKKVFVLINTGCYDPIHIGHVKMMENAYEHLTSLGYIVLGGFLIPAHTKYVISKNGTDSYLERLEKCQKFVNKHQWLCIDPYEILFESDDVCYTDIIVRLENYIKVHINDYHKLDVQVAYVCGGDRAEFMRTFVKIGNAVCVGRDGYDMIKEKIKAELSSCDNFNNLFWTSNVQNYSSTQLRNQEREIKASTDSTDLTNIIDENRVYYIRNEKLAFPDYDDFCEKIFGVFSEIFSTDPKIIVKMLFADEQNKKLQLLSNPYKSISLDPFIESNYYINISRLFAFGCPKSFIRMIERPNFLSINDQVMQIPIGNYCLIDDDSVSGKSLDFAKHILNTKTNSSTTSEIQKIKITQHKLLTQLENSDIKMLDVIDCRDFLCGSHIGGLVVELPNGQIARVPYMLPYVYPSDRASIPVKLNISFSKLIWRLNLEYYTIHDKKVKDIDISTRTFLNYIGFCDDHPMKFVCAWHLLFFD